MLRKALTRFFAALFLLALVLFLPAGTLNYWQAWLYLGTLFIPLIFVVSYFLKTDPAFLVRRLRFREKESHQKRIQAIVGIIFILGFLIPGLDHRFGWSSVPILFVLVADVAVLFGYLFIVLVFRENNFASRIVEVEAGQRVISTGPYAYIRHPMYLGVILMYLPTPLALGSWWGLLVFLMIPIFLAIRIKDEEELLVRDLPGYAAYREKVRYRLIPYIW